MRCGDSARPSSPSPTPHMIHLHPNTDCLPDRFGTGEVATGRGSDSDLPSTGTRYNRCSDSRSASLDFGEGDWRRFFVTKINATLILFPSSCSKPR